MSRGGLAGYDAERFVARTLSDATGEARPSAGLNQDAHMGQVYHHAPGASFADPHGLWKGRPSRVKTWLAKFARAPAVPLGLKIRRSTVVGVRIWT